jgi:hypoxanthine phosphoribosyltransferase
MSDQPEVLFTEEQISRRVSEIAAEVTTAYAGRELCVVGVMKSALVLMADLIRRVPLQSTCHFLRSSVLRESSDAGARTDIVYATEIPYEERDILLLAPVIDTGITLNFLLDHVRERGPASLRVCALVDKPGERKVDIAPDWSVFRLDDPLPSDRFLVGYGLDHADRYRGLPYIGTIPRPTAAGPGGETDRR